MPGPAVGRCRIAATATAHPVYIRMKVPISSATAEPIRLLESTWLPYKPCACSPLELPPRRPRFLTRLAVSVTLSIIPDEPPDREAERISLSLYPSSPVCGSGARRSLDAVFADPPLLLDHGALLGEALFLGHRHRDLVLADLRLRGLPALDRHPLHADLFVPGGHPYLLAVGSHL